MPRRKRVKRSEDNGPKRTTTIRFTYEEYMEFALRGKPQPGASSVDNEGSRRTNEGDWSGCKTWEECVNLAENGWPEGCEKMGTIVEQLDKLEAGEVTLPQPFNDVTGDYVDMGAFLEGVPENMVRWEEMPSQKRVARILFNNGVSGGVSKDAIQWKGAAVLALIDRLEATGIRVELDIIWKSKSYDGDVDSMFYNVKKAEDSLHIDRLAFHLVHPSSLRRLGFAAAENRDAEIVNRIGYYSGGNYGVPTKVSAEEAEGYDLVIPELNLETVEDSVRAIEKMFGQLCNLSDDELVKLE